MSNDEISVQEFFPSIPNVAESFNKKHHGETHSRKEWEKLFAKHMREEGWDMDDDEDMAPRCLLAQVREEAHACDEEMHLWQMSRPSYVQKREVQGSSA